jgi:cell migration-inducing and hyaluronan-binding protein
LLESTDWAVGEEIVIATTSFDNDQSETRIITGVSGSTYTFAEPLVYQHLSVVPVYDGVPVPMQAEVGLLTRNIVYRGDPETSSANLYGAHIMVHSPGDESSVGRIEYVELRDVGQAYKLGRYPIHFHMIGTVHKSYVRGNAIH